MKLVISKHTSMQMTQGICHFSFRARTFFMRILWIYQGPRGLKKYLEKKYLQFTLFIN